MNIESRIERAIKAYGRKAQKPASGQGSLFDESQHPRDDDGKFTEKESASESNVTETDELDFQNKNDLSSLPQKGPDEIVTTTKGSVKAFNQANSTKLTEKEYDTLTKLFAVQEMPIERRDGQRFFSMNAEHYQTLRQLAWDGFAKMIHGDERKYVITDKAKSALDWGHKVEASMIAKASMANFKPESVPGEQRNLFGEETTGQKQLFDIVTPGKSRKKSESKPAAKSLLEDIEDEHKSKKVAPLPGQLDMYARFDRAQAVHERRIAE